MGVIIYKPAVFPELLVTGHVTENFSRAMGRRLAGQGIHNDPVPEKNTSRSIR